jgi:hypothetical protein
MTTFDKAVYDELLGKVDAAVTAHDKGETFEDVAEYVLGTLNGVEVMGRDADMAAEEIDLLLWNAQVEEVLRPWDGTILVECKNWTAKVAAPQLDSFISKIRRRSLKTGMLVAANGVTGGYANGSASEPGGAVELIRSALQEGIRVITITMGDLRVIGCTDDLRTLIKRRYCGLYVHRVL